MQTTLRGQKQAFNKENKLKDQLVIPLDYEHLGKEYAGSIIRFGLDLAVEQTKKNITALKTLKNCEDIYKEELEILEDLELFVITTFLATFPKTKE